MTVRRWVAGILALVVLAGAAAPAMAATGPDVASWQHPGGAAIDWHAVAASGQRFAFIKADEGPSPTRPSYYTNPYFHGDWAGAAAAGLYRGTYHYAQPRLPASSAIDDARHFVSVAGTMRGAGDLPPVLDLEEHNGLSPGDLLAWTSTWLQEVERLVGRPPMIYTGRYYWATYMGGTTALSHYRLWVASWYDNINPPPRLTPPGGVAPSLFGGWSTWTFWQHTASANLPGVQGLSDMNVYCCSDANLAALANGTAAAADAGNPFGVVDGIERLSSGHHRLTGWALDPDTTAPIPVHLWTDVGIVGEFPAAASRPDIATAYPGWGPAHGIDATFTPPPGAREVCAYAINVGGGTANNILGCRPLDGRPYGNLDAAVGREGHLVVRGWAIDPGTADPVAVAVRVDGRPTGTWRADGHRPDVGTAYPGYGDHHGFEVTINGVAAGSHQVCVAIPDVGGAGATDLGCEEVDVDPGPPGFWDVPPGHPFLDEITWLAETGIVEGYGDGSFQPGAVVTRQALAAFLLRLHDAAGGAPPAQPGPAFSDVPANHPFADEIGTLAALGVIEGYGDGTFRPADPVSRQAAAGLVARLYEVLGGEPAVGPAFSDVPAGHPFAAEIGWLAEAGVVEGYGDGTFRPADPVSRQAAAAFLHRLDLLLAG